MVSVNTNFATIATIHALRETRAAIEASQARVATGLRIRGPSDGLTAWRTSLALKSERTALSAVHDALNLGAARVDTAYFGLASTLDTLHDLRSKLMTASQAGADKTAIQSAIAALKDRLRSIASASTFSGENWLSVDSAAADYSRTKSILASTLRSAGVAAIDVDIRKLTLIDANSAVGGILDSTGSSSLSTGGLADRTDTGTVRRDATASEVVYQVALADLRPNQKIYFQIESESRSLAWYEIRVPGSGFSGIADFAAALNAKISSFATVDAVAGTSSISIRSKTLGTSSSISLKKINIYDYDPATNYTTYAYASPFWDETAKNGSSGSSAVAFRAAEVSMGGFLAMAFGRDDAVSFEIAVDGGAAKLVTVDRGIVEAALPGANGRIADEGEFRDVLTKAMAAAGVAGVSVSHGTGALRLKSTASSGPTSLSIARTALQRGASIMEIDVTAKSEREIATYLSATDAAIRSIEAAAAGLGAVSRRIEVHTRFTTTLMDIMDRTVSELVDADLAGEVATLKALRVKEQLGIRALSITSSSSRNILMLFDRPAGR